MENIKLKISIPKHCERDVYTPAHLKTTTRCYIYWSRYFVCRHPQYWLLCCCDVTSGLLAACIVALLPTVLHDLLWMNVMCWLLALFFPTSVTWDALLWWLQCWLWETVRFFIIFILVISRFWGPRWHSGEGALLQIGRLLVRFQMVSLEFFIDIILPITPWPWGQLSP